MTELDPQPAHPVEASRKVTAYGPKLASMTSQKAFPMTEYIPTPEDDELEATIGRLFDQLEDAREDSGILERMMPFFSTCFRR